MAYDPETTPQVGELDELEMRNALARKHLNSIQVNGRAFVGQKKNQVWLWTAVDHFQPGILAWVLGAHSAETFNPLWNIVATWKCYFYVTDGGKVYPQYIPDGDQIICQT